MIEKIVSGGQTGADRAALDAAIELEIPHGGWLPKGRRAEDGPLDERYALKEMPVSDYRARTEQNVIDSDGTLIFFFQMLSGGSLYTEKMAKKHNRPKLTIDLSVTGDFEAAQIIAAWIYEKNIRILNVAGPKASKESTTYSRVRPIIKTVIYLDLVMERTGSLFFKRNTYPSTLSETIALLEKSLTMQEKFTLANMSGENMADVIAAIKEKIINKNKGLFLENSLLIDDISGSTGFRSISADESVDLMIKELIKRLASTHRLKLVKNKTKE